MKYFQNCKTLDELKAAFKTLAKQYHPDLSGYDSTATMQEINKEYSFLSAKIAKGGNFTQQECEAEILNAEAYRQALEKVIILEGINIELVGTWIWVTGETYAYRSKEKGGTGQLKEAGFLFASAKKAWFFRTEENKAPNGGKSQSLDQIKNKYGSVQLTGNYKRSYQIA